MNELITYLNWKKVPFAIKKDYTTGEQSLFGIKLTKEGRLFKANGKVIRRQYALILMGV